VEERIVFHVDMDAFFAAVEVKCNPLLKGKPLIVGGDPKGRGVVSTASYEARKYGVRSGMPLGEAKRKCPRGIFIEGNPDKYVNQSVEILRTMKKYTPLVEPFSIDEAFMEIPGAKSREDSLKIAMRFKQEILRKHKLTCSVGIAPNKIIAKHASSLEKPDGLTLLGKEEFRKVFRERSVGELWGVGDKTRKVLERAGIITVGQLASFPEKKLRLLFGKTGPALRDLARGEDDSPVIPYFEGVEQKSMGHEYTFSSDVSDRERLEAVLLGLSEKVCRRARLEGYKAQTVTLKIRFDTFETHTRQKTIDSPTDDERLVYKIAKGLFGRIHEGKRVRLLGVSLSCLVDQGKGFANTLFDEENRFGVVNDIIDEIKDRFGERSITRAGVLIY